MRLTIRDTKQEVGDYIADYIAKRINTFKPKPEHPKFVLGCPTGSSPLPVYKRLVELYKAGKVSFKVSIAGGVAGVIVTIAQHRSLHKPDDGPDDQRTGSDARICGTHRSASRQRCCEHSTTHPSNPPRRRRLIPGCRDLQHGRVRRHPARPPRVVPHLHVHQLFQPHRHRVSKAKQSSLQRGERSGAGHRVDCRCFLYLG